MPDSVVRIVSRKSNRASTTIGRLTGGASRPAGAKISPATSSLNRTRSVCSCSGAGGSGAGGSAAGSGVGSAARAGSGAGVGSTVGSPLAAAGSASAAAASAAGRSPSAAATGSSAASDTSPSGSDSAQAGAATRQPTTSQPHDRRAIPSPFRRAMPLPPTVLRPHHRYFGTIGRDPRPAGRRHDASTAPYPGSPPPRRRIRPRNQVSRVIKCLIIRVSAGKRPAGQESFHPQPLSASP